MSGKKGKSGGARPGAGRPRKGKTKAPKDYIMLRLAKPRTAEEQRAIKYAKFLSPAERLETFVESLSFQDWDESEGWIR